MLVNYKQNKNITINYIKLDMYMNSKNNKKIRNYNKYIN